MKLTYFVHDLNDPAVWRRVRMLRDGGATVSLLGFTRGAVLQASDAICLGATRNARMVHRSFAVLRAGLGAGAWRAAVAGAEVILARQLEMLLLAALARRRFAPRARLVFECLDVHRLMLADGAAGRALRWLEGALLDRSDQLLVSSPAFVEAYFARVHAALPPVRLVENRVLTSELAMPAATAHPPGHPWRIGWFGVIRCRASLEMLARLVRRFPGQVEVIIRGRPSRDAVPDFDAIVAATPGLHFLGPYDRAADLAAIYADVHYVWAIDFYEAGANSTWLLPNRLYEGGAFGAIPIADRAPETGAWLAARQVGIRLDDPIEPALAAFIAGLTPARHEANLAAMRRLPRAAFVCDAAGCRDLAAALAVPRPPHAGRPAA
jgi:hypothetical protein